MDDVKEPDMLREMNRERMGPGDMMNAYGTYQDFYTQCEMLHMPMKHIRNLL